MSWASYGPSQATLMNVLLRLARNGPVKATTVGQTKFACQNKTTCAITKPVLAQDWHVSWMERLYDYPCEMPQHEHQATNYTIWSMFLAWKKNIILTQYVNEHIKSGRYCLTIVILIGNLGAAEKEESMCGSNVQRVWRSSGCCCLQVRWRPPRVRSAPTLRGWGGGGGGWGFDGWLVAVWECGIS